MFIAALFTIARMCKQSKCPSTDEWIKMWYITQSWKGMKKAICREMDGPVIQSEVSHKEKQISYVDIYMWNLEKMVQMNLFPK